MNVHHRNLPRVIIVGGGFGGLSAARALRKAPVRVTLLDRQNHHLFQPLLYQVATAALSPADIAEPLRHVVRKQENCEVLLAEVKSIDVGAKKIVTDIGELDYDYLVVATGARHHYFGKDQWEKFAPGLKSLDDALNLRRRMLLAFELAETTKDDAERKAAMTFVVVGGGPTGVEMAGAIAEIARQTLVRDFRHIDSSHARVILVENSPEVLTVFSDDLSKSASKQLRRIGVELKLSSMVQDMDETGVKLASGEHIPAKTVVWAAGNKASPLGATLGVPLDRGGRVIVNPDLSIPNHPEVFVIGDLANFATEGGPLPGLASVAVQQGPHVAKNIQLLLAGGWTKPFEYWDKGTMATIGRYAAVADVGFMRFTGFIAWLAWLFIHLILLVSFRSKVGVLASWAYTYIVYGRKARLITGRDAHLESVSLPHATIATTNK
jgi:NADH:ubiquinone reductase (H+-translocating)